MGMIRLGLAAVILLSGGLVLDPPASAQDEVPGAGDPGIAGEDVGDLEGLDLSSVEEGEGLEAAISGNEYRLGPGDALAISIWGPQPLAYNLRVTLEGKLLIPLVGEIDVNDLLLAEAKDKVRQAILRDYRNVEVSVTLTRLRRFQIHVLGQVRSPGTYLATGVNRVSYAVARANGFARNASQRRIRVENGDSLRTEADLFAFLKRGIVDKNPLLRDGDKIFVPFSHDRFRVLGSVNDPGSIQLLPGDRLSNAIRLGGGLSDQAFLDTLEVARYAPEATDPIRFFVLNGGGIVPADPETPGDIPAPDGTFEPKILGQGRSAVYSDFVLQPDDIVFVRGAPQYAKRRLVEIRGEVKFPGNYSFHEGRTRLSDLVAWAGGLTENAFLTEARIIRREDIGLRDPEFERLKNMTVADMDDDEYAYFKAKAREVPGQMVVDFQKALIQGDPSEDILLVPEDVVVIPREKDYVSVIGTVARPGNVTYKAGLKARDYVDLAGGYARDADRGDSRVIRANGEWVTFSKAGPLQPGDVVFVPEKPDGNFWRVFRGTLTVTAQILTIYLVADRALQ